ncbi:MAG: hypothetical protein HQK50_13780 [Oligoflexia bacterium]|nr:hypothetical protein [Oligoflexia bacterium]MBF0366638.1 hypothetical protein [Oligoflexia bacterium]
MKSSYKIKIATSIIIMLCFLSMLVVDVSVHEKWVSTEMCVAGGLLALLLYMWVAFLRPVWRLDTLVVKDLMGTISKIQIKYAEVDKKCEEFIQEGNNQFAIISDHEQWITEIESAIHKALGSAEESRGHIRKNNMLNDETREVVANLRSAMNAISGAATSLEGIVTMIGEINKKTDIINDIVFETKLLSFNASIEAARAGQYGKGFAVVAQEIGSLAVMSGKASLSISSLLESNTIQVKELVSYIHDRIKEGEDATEACNRVFARITEGGTHVASTIENIVGFIKSQQNEVRNLDKKMNNLFNAINNNKGHFNCIHDNIQEFIKDVKKIEEPLSAMQLIVDDGLQISIETDDETDIKTDIETDIAMERGIFDDTEKEGNENTIARGRSIDKNEEETSAALLSDLHKTVLLSPDERAKEIVKSYNRAIKKSQEENAREENIEVDDQRFVDKNNTGT